LPGLVWVLVQSLQALEEQTTMGLLVDWRLNAQVPQEESLEELTMLELLEGWMLLLQVLKKE